MEIKDSDIADFSERVAIITGTYRSLVFIVYSLTCFTSGGASGIGLATARILASHGAVVHVLDITGPHEADGPNPGSIRFHRVDVASWPQLLSFFENIGPVHVAIANAGVSQVKDHFASEYDTAGMLLEPEFDVLDVNFKAVLYFIKLGLANFKSHGTGGSIVVTTSATGLFPEQSLPIYSACKAGIIGLVRALRASLPLTHDTTINAVAPAATVSRLLPEHLAAPIRIAGLPISTAHHVGMAVAFSADARQEGQVELYGKDDSSALHTPSRWNGRTILTLGDTYTEVEEKLSTLRPAWAGRYATEMTWRQQLMTDFRPVPGTGGSGHRGEVFGHPSGEASKAQS